MGLALTPLHARRLREIWRSAGWPCQDMVEVELLDAGLLQRHRDDAGRETLRVTDAGIALLAQTLRKNRAARDAHEALVERVALEMQRAGRIAWRGLSLRAQVGQGDASAWAMAMPDVFSIRHTRSRPTWNRWCTRSRCSAPTCWPTCGRKPSAPPICNSAASAGM